MNGSENDGCIGGKPFPSPQRRGTNCFNGQKCSLPCGQKASWRETTANTTESAPPISRHWEKQRKPEANGTQNSLRWQSTWKLIPGAAPSAGKWRRSECGICGKNKFADMRRETGLFWRSIAESVLLLALFIDVLVMLGTDRY